MSVYGETFTVETCENRASYHQVTDEVKQIVADSKIKDGIVVVNTPHTTCSVFFEEYMHDTNYHGDEYLQVDLNSIFDKIAPRCVTEGQYYSPGPKHIDFAMNLADPNYPPDPGTVLNTEAHLRASIIGASETFIIRGGEIQIGAVGYIYFVDWDQNRKRNRKIQVQVMGE